MTWRDQYRQGSFRGVPFLTSASEASHGRRNVVHEYPMRDEPFVEDLGRRAASWRLDAFFVGDDYRTHRDRLIAAIEQSGPGTLLHPYFGELTVSVVDWSVRESTVDGGLCTISMSFVETGKRREPAQAIDSQAELRTAAQRAQAQAEADFTSGAFAVAKRPQYIADGVGSLVKGVLASVQQAAGSVGAKAAEVAELARQAKQFNRDLVSIIYVPASTAQALVASMKQLIREVAVSPLEALGLAKPFFRFGSSLPNVQPSTASRAQQVANQAAIVQLVRVSAVAQAALAVAEASFDSYEESVGVRDEFVAAVDEIADAGLGDELFLALTAVRTALVRDITQRGADLARLVAFTPNTTTPALVVAWRLYADAGRADEIVRRNAIAHPGFLPGNVALQVATDA